MIRTIATAIAASALVLLGAGVAHADTSADIAAQCARATIPTALCGNGTGATTNNGIGKALKVDPGKYYSGNKADVVVGYDKDKPLLDGQGNVKTDPKTGEILYTPITAAGDPVFTQKPADPDAVDLSGYQYK